MPITPVALTAPGYAASHPVAKTLRELAVDLGELQAGARTSLFTADDHGTLFSGLYVTAGTFPVVAVSAGGIVDPTGAVYSLAAGTVNVTATASAITWVYVDSDFNVTASATVPTNAALVLARVVVDDAGTGFDVIDPTTITEELQWDGDNLVSLRVLSGPIVIRLEATEFNAEGDPVITYTEFAGRVYTTSYVYDAANELETIVYGRDYTRPLLLSGGFVLDGSQALDGLY